MDEASTAVGGNKVAREHGAGFGKKGDAALKHFIT
jgi:hypothetical protein